MAAGSDIDEILDPVGQDVAGREGQLDGVAIEFLGPDSAWTASLDDPNEASVVMLIMHRKLKQVDMIEALKSVE